MHFKSANNNAEDPLRRSLPVTGGTSDIVFGKFDKELFAAMSQNTNL